MLKRQHKVMLSNELWIVINERAALEERSASGLCNYVIQHYVDLAPPDRPAILLRQVKPEAALRSLYIDKVNWAKLRALKVEQRRPISAIIEQQMRLYLGLDV